jgi:ABC-type lipoprotein export system ATPase subunit
VSAGAALSRPWERSGSQTEPTTSPTQLSGGEQQRAAIARALVVHPSVVLLDEPTGNLDSASAGEVLTILERVNRQGATMVIVTHSRRGGVARLARPPPRRRAGSWQTSLSITRSYWRRRRDHDA